MSRCPLQVKELEKALSELEMKFARVTRELQARIDELEPELERSKDKERDAQGLLADYMRALGLLKVSYDHVDDDWLSSTAVEISLVILTLITLV